MKTELFNHRLNCRSDDRGGQVLIRKPWPLFGLVCFFLSAGRNTDENTRVRLGSCKQALRALGIVTSRCMIPAPFVRISCPKVILRALAGMVRDFELAVSSPESCALDYGQHSGGFF